MSQTEKIVLGSGLLYLQEFAGTIPEDTTLEVDSNILGYVKGGASLEYTIEIYEAKDDLERVSKIILTSEEAILKAGVMTWNGTTLKKLCSTARVTDDAEGGKRTVKIGGMQNYDGKKYVIRFLHEDPVDGDTRLTIVGSNQAGLTITFAKDEETVLNPEFKAMPHDSEGTLILYEEEIKGSTQLTSGQSSPSDPTSSGTDSGASDQE